jgi:esterase
MRVASVPCFARLSPLRGLRAEDVPRPLLEWTGKRKASNPTRMLNIIRHDGPAGQVPLLIAHGLFGSGRNWGVIAKRLSNDRTVLAVDMRNHGSSPWSDSHTYADMAEDLAEVIRASGSPMAVLGHSMGGKAAMVLALQHPDLVDSLIIGDIAPVSYNHDQSRYIEAMQAVDLSRAEKRSDAEAQLADLVDNPTLPAFFTQSLDIKDKRWRLNLDALADQMPHILGFPEIEGRFGRPALFLTGAQSDYVGPQHRDRIKSLFPAARFAKIPDAGHWLHAEKPREFEAALRVWLEG